MNSTDKPVNRKTGMLIAKNLIVMIVLITVVFLSSFSWFTQTTKATANGISVESKAPDGLEIAIVAHGATAPSDEDYVTGSISLNSENCDFLKDLFFSEITGSGKNDEFYKPKLNQSNGKAYPDTEAEWDKAEANSHYISFDLYMRSKSPQTVYLQDSTFLKPVSSVLSWAEGVDSSAYNPSTAGNFSRDCIVGATRVSVVDTSNKLKLLWIPAPNIRLSDNADSVQTDLTEGDSYVHNYYAVTDTTKTLIEAENVVANNNLEKLYSLGQKPVIAELDTRADNDPYYVNHVTCNIWIEGEDPEARLALTGGKFKVSLQLTIN